jgi:hypothetical protein
MAGITITFSRGYGFSSKLVSECEKCPKGPIHPKFLGGGRGRLPPSPSRVRYWRSYSNLCLLYSPPKVKTLAIQLYFNRFMFQTKKVQRSEVEYSIQFTLLYLL